MGGGGGGGGPVGGVRRGLGAARSSAPSVASKSTGQLWDSRGGGNSAPPPAAAAASSSSSSSNKDAPLGPRGNGSMGGGAKGWRYDGATHTHTHSLTHNRNVCWYALPSTVRQESRAILLVPTSRARISQRIRTVRLRALLVRRCRLLAARVMLSQRASRSSRPRLRLRLRPRLSASRKPIRHRDRHRNRHRARNRP